jgi:hypothetical protein
MVPLFRIAVFTVVIVPLLIRLSISPGLLLRKPQLPSLEIIPLLVMVVLLDPCVFTAVLVVLSIVTPELIVTLEPSPSITNTEQFAVIVSVVPEMPEQSADNALLDANTQNPSVKRARDMVIIVC